MPEPSRIALRHRLLVGAGLGRAVFLVAGCASAPPFPPASLQAAQEAIEVAEQ